ncbi:MAG: ShlB/FhaC/HecB family hemolysin secretion/activation protein [Gallionellaceae bacterium]|nr:ShlB/FhaC/HecB family hemolysin secretion/activation protein [Gallionellaceae bacterium]
MQQIRPVEPPAPLPDGTGLKIDPGAAAQLPASAPFTVSSIRIAGNRLFDTATLHALVRDAEGKELTLSQLGELAARITAYYRDHGYPLARAFIPAQTIRDGLFTIEVIEARYGRIGLDNRSTVRDKLLEATLSGLQSDQPIEQSALDRSLLLLSDIPGIVNSATLRPGEATGTSDLLVESAAGAAVSGNLMLDGYGNRYTGRARAGGTVNFINPLHMGDILGASVMFSGKGMNYGRLSYESLLNGYGTRAGASWSSMRYVLGDTLEPLNAHGSAQVTGLWARHPLVRSRNANISAQMQYEHKQLRDHIDMFGFRTDRHLENWTASLSGDMRDTLLSDSINTWNLGWTSGSVGFDDPAAQLADALTAGTQGGFSKWNAAFTSLQGLSPANELYLAVMGQWANSNLDSAEKMVVGGPATVRAYDTGAASGDEGYFAGIEFRHMHQGAWNGRWQGVLFIDTGHLKINRNTWVSGTNSATLSGAGIGLNWNGPERWSGRIHVAKPIGPTPELLGSNRPSVQAWGEISKSF